MVGRVGYNPDTNSTVHIIGRDDDDAWLCVAFESTYIFIADYVIYSMSHLCFDVEMAPGDLFNK